MCFISADLVLLEITTENVKIILVGLVNNNTKVVILIKNDNLNTHPVTFVIFRSKNVALINTSFLTLILIRVLVVLVDPNARFLSPSNERGGMEKCDVPTPIADAVVAVVQRLRLVTFS